MVSKKCHYWPTKTLNKHILVSAQIPSILIHVQESCVQSGILYNCNHWSQNYHSISVGKAPNGTESERWSPKRCWSWRMSKTIAQTWMKFPRTSQLIFRVFETNITRSWALRRSFSNGPWSVSNFRKKRTIRLWNFLENIHLNKCREDTKKNLQSFCGLFLDFWINVMEFYLPTSILNGFKIFGLLCMYIQ